MFFHDLRHAVRSLANAKGPALTVVVTLALGIGANGRLALGAEPKKILSSVLLEGVIIAVIGVAVGVGVGFALSRLIGSYVAELRSPDTLPLVGASMLILAAAVFASVLPAARAARVDAIQALRSE